MSGSRSIIVLCVALGVLGSASAAVAGGKQKALHANASAAVAPVGVSALEALTVPHSDKGWDHGYQSSCDVNPDCNGWNQRMEAYKRSIQAK